MQNRKKLLAVLLLDEHAACFVRDDQPSWRHECLFGEHWYHLNDRTLADVLGELGKRINCTDCLAGFSLHIIYDQATLPWLTEVALNLQKVKCGNWQVLQWEPLRNRSALLNGNSPDAQPPSIDWLQKCPLPLLEATFSYQEDALSAERVRVNQEHIDTMESLRADRLRLEAQIALQREQLTALQHPAMDDVLIYLPAIFRNVFGTIAPHDLALLVGSLQAPQISSPWPEPAPDTLLTLQARLRKLPEQPAVQKLRVFCKTLRHKLEIRAEMRAWLEIIDE